MKKIVFVLITLFTASIVFAGLGGIPFEVLNKGTGVRIMSMGEAGVANCFDATAIFWNPAYLDALNKNEVYMSVETFFEGANYEQLSVVTPMGLSGGLGLFVGLMNYGTYEKFDVDGNPGTEEGVVRDIFGTLSYGKLIFAGIQTGLSLKFIIKSIEDKSYMGFNSDIAFYRPFGDMWDAGLIVKNFIPVGVKFEEDEEKFVTSIRAGLGLKLLEKQLRFAIDAEQYFIKSNPIIYTGLEYNLFGVLYLRAGYNTAGDITSGVGISYQDILFDYGVAINDLLISHKFALSYKFGGYELKLKAEPDVFSPIGGNKKTYIRVYAKAKYEIYKWKVEITDWKGNVVKSWFGSGQPDEVLIWDGLKSDGMPMDEAEYRAVLTVVDENDVSNSSDPIKIKISSTDKYNIPILGE
jgi:hypothetical protein